MSIFRNITTKYPSKLFYTTDIYGDYAHHCFVRNFFYSFAKNIIKSIQKEAYMNITELINTDLALERVPENINKDGIASIEGARIHTEFVDNIIITDITVLSEPAISVIGKPCGRYITVEAPDCTNVNKLSDILSTQILKLVGNNISSVLIAGLGNRHIISDSLGTKTADKINVSRILSDYIKMDTNVNISAISPGVLGETGIETLEILNGVCSVVKPDALIAIDSLCARDIHRIATTFQLTDTGINPGAGLGNMRKPLNEESLGCKVIGIGVPTVVYARTVCHNIMERLARKSGINAEVEIEGIIDELDDAFVKTLVVTPKDIDELSDTAANIISKAINTAFNTVKFS